MNKKKLLVVAMVLSMVAVLAIGGTLAYFTDNAELTNTFTTGDISMTLDEAVVEQDANGDYVAVGEDRDSDGQAYDLHPGITVKKDPTIHLDTEGLEAYVAAKIIVSGADLDSLISNYPPYLTTYELITGGAAVPATYVGDWQGLTEVHSNDQAMFYQDVTNAENNEWVIYMFFKAPYEGEQDIVLFDTLTVPAEYTNAQMQKLEGMNIKVEGFAAQIDTFSDAGMNDGVGCLEAMKAAFPTEFAFGNQQ